MAGISQGMLGILLRVTSSDDDDDDNDKNEL